MSFISARVITHSLKSFASTDKAKNLSRFFKTGRGQYGEGDKFLGIVVPDIRRVAKEYYKQVTLETIQQLVKSPYHEVRLCGLIMLVHKYNELSKTSLRVDRSPAKPRLNRDRRDPRFCTPTKSATATGQSYLLKKEIFDFYLSHTKYINNWDLVDLTAPNIVGNFLLQNDTPRRRASRYLSSRAKSRDPSTLVTRSRDDDVNVGVSTPKENDAVTEDTYFAQTTGFSRGVRRKQNTVSREELPSILEKLSQSQSLWERRIAILSTFSFIRAGRHQEAFTIGELLLNDKHDLIHKAVGWMLREVGKRIGKDVLRDFLNKHAATMPRTTLRYAIEHLSERERKQYMNIN